MKEHRAIRKQGAGGTGRGDWQQVFSMLWNCPKKDFSSRASNNNKSCLVFIGKNISCTTKAKLVLFIKKNEAHLLKVKFMPKDLTMDFGRQKK